MLEFLDAASAEYPDNPAILFRQAFANGMGHNLDFPGCAEKAIEAYERVIDIEPENQRANYYYGAFLSGTTLFKKSIPYLEKAIQLGETDAHYTLAFVYIKLGNPKMALPEFKAYLVSDPDNRTAKKMVSEIESNTLSTQFHETPPLNGGVIYESSSIQPSK